MGNRITRISRRAFKTKKKKSKNNDRDIIKDAECQCRMFPVTGPTSPTCAKCVSGFMQEIETNRLNGKYAVCSGHWGFIDNSDCGAQFDAKKFDKVFKLNVNRSLQLAEAEYDDDSEFEDALSDSFQSETSEISKKRPESMQDDDDNNSYFSIFEVFEKMELLNLTTLDEMFFYPAIGGAAQCDDSIQNTHSKSLTTQFNVKNASSSTSINDEKKQFDEEKQFDDETSFDETHLYDTVASSEEFDDVICKGSQNTSMNSAEQLKSDDLNEAIKSKNITNCDATQHKPIPFNATQFDTKQIDNKKFDGILFNDSQFDAKYFDATPFDVTPFLATQLKKSEISASKLNSALQHNEIRPFKETQFKASQFDATTQLKTIKPNAPRLENEEPSDVTKKHCDDTRFSSIPLNAPRSDVTEFEDALIRTAQFVASHFGAEGFNKKHSGTKNFIATSFRTTQFNASQFDAKQFDDSQLSFSQFDATQLDVTNFNATQFAASRFDAKAFDTQKCNRLPRNPYKFLKFAKPQIYHDNCFNVTQFDAKLFNATHFNSGQRVYAT